MRLKLAVISLCCLAIISCKKQPRDETIIVSYESKGVSNPKNPYSVANMRNTISKLLVEDIRLINSEQTKYAKGKVMFAQGEEGLSINKKLSAEQSFALTSNNIGATHYYIKFMPSSEADYNKLKIDSNLIIYPFPLDNANTAGKANHREPALSKSALSYQYAAVPISYRLPDVPYQILEDLFLPDVRDSKNSLILRGDNGSSYTINTRTIASRAECGGNEGSGGPGGGVHEEEVPVDDDCDDGGSYPPGDPYSNGDEWRPNGRITLFDEVKNETIGVEGIKVRARRWFTTYTGIADENGYYAVDGWFTRPANYWLDFERYDFSVNDHRGGPREIDGPKIKAPWNLDLTGFDKFCGNIFRASYHYYYKDIQGLRRPPQNSFWATQVKIAAFDWYQNADNGDMWAGRNLLFGSLIHIYHPQNTSMETYATTIHELAHASHWNMSSQIVGPFYTKFGASDLNVVESWAAGVQWVLTKMEYPNYYGRFNGSNRYTNIVMDMIDAPGEVFYQSAGNGLFYQHGEGSPIDEVGNYSIVQLENALRNQTTLTDWKNHLFNNYENTTKQNLEPLFNYYINLP